MTTTKRFHLGDILSITTERLVSPRHMDGVYDVLNWMTGDSLFTHQLPRAAEECKPHLLAQNPDLAGIPEPEFARADEVELWLADMVARFGEHREVAPIPAADHTVIDPLAELSMMAPGKPVIVVQLPDAES